MKRCDKLCPKPDAEITLPMKIPLAISEQQRLDAIDGYDILDSKSEIGFDDVVLLARQLCSTPIALISLVASTRQWFKAAAGLERYETPIEQSVCAHALQQTSTMVIPDLTLDPRTQNNMLVTQPPHIRFYAGAVLVSSSGVPIGTVCVIDIMPRPQGLTPDQIAGLEALARQVMVLMELRRALVAGESTNVEQRSANFEMAARNMETERLSGLLRLNETRLRLAQEAGQIGSFEVDMANDEMTVTEQFCHIFGLPPTPTIHATAVEQLVFPSDAHIMSNMTTRRDGDISMFAEYRIRRADTGQTIWISRRAQFLHDADGKAVRMIGTVHDVTGRKEIEQRQTLLNHELSHRLKNTLALVQAIASQTLRGIADKDAVRAFELRVDALSRAHDVLLQQSWAAANMHDIMTGVLGMHGNLDRIDLEGPTVNVGSKAALSLSLLFHELATNAIKYGALSVPGGRVAITWRKQDQRLILTWDEKGGPPALPPTRIGLGSRLVNMGLVGTGGVNKSYAASGFRVEFKADLSAVEDVSLPM